MRHFLMRMYRTLAAAATLALTLGGAALAAPAAMADTTSTATIDWDGGNSALWYRAAPGQTNDLTVTVTDTGTGPSQPDYDYVITFDDQVDISFVPADRVNCSYPTPADHTLVQCTDPEPLGSDDSDIYDVDLGDGNDTATVDGQTTVYGGAGDDTLHGSGENVYHGGDGNDVIDAAGYATFGDAGDDILTNCQWECDGGDGNDSLTATTDGDAPSRTLNGGAGEDTLQGSAGVDILHGGDDNDLIYGAQGNDELYGEGGDDTMYGNSGDDLLHGGAGNDTLSGGPGTNQVYQD
jgi:Ca2+-binding RTX toxin-like protein